MTQEERRYSAHLKDDWNGVAMVVVSVETVSRLMQDMRQAKL
ncbi:MAG: hypothetical protein Q8N96_15370 [Methylovulum sp.]|nr:hypothetical protein [Methylovulum sp.]